MLPNQTSTPQSAAQPRHTPLAAPDLRVGVGIDTSRYGHYAAFLRPDLQPAAGELLFAESAAGYGQLHQRLAQIAQRHGAVHFVIRLDAAGQYADNLLHFLHSLPGAPGPVGNPAADAAPLANATFTISCGDPQRNKNYRAALFGNKKSDPLEARAAARYALSERPAGTRPWSAELRLLRQVAGRLQAVCRQRTRLLNQLHHLSALTFPELGLLVKDLAAGWVLELLHRYPTAPRLAAAAPADLEDIPYLPHAHIDRLGQDARASIASLHGPAIEELVRDQVRQLRDAGARQKRLEKVLISTYNDLQDRNYLDSIPGIGAVTAALLTAFIGDIERFDTPGKLVAYFGTLPIEVASGVDRDGNPRGPKRYVMSPRGNDLVRRYLWMAALSAVRHNPAVRALYARVVAKHPDQKAIAIGHAMRKLLHLGFAVWKSQMPFDPNHYPWHAPAHVPEGAAGSGSERPTEAGSGAEVPPLDPTLAQDKEPAAGHKNPDWPERKVVTAAGSIPSTPGPHAAVDFAHVKKQLPLARVLDQLGLSGRLRGSGPQKRCPCPLHRGDARGQTLSVNLDENVFYCHAQAVAREATSSTCGLVSRACPCATLPSTWCIPSTSNPCRDAAQRRGHGGARWRRRPAKSRLPTDAPALRATLS
jgi:transposase